MADALRLHVEPTRVDIKPGGDAAVLTARVYNATRIVDEFHVAVIGTGQWLDAQPARVRLFPDTDGSVEVEILIPKDRLVTAGLRTVGVKATSVSNPAVTGTEQVQVNVIEVVAGEGIKLDPSVVHGGQDGEMIATVRNGANVPMNVVMLGEDPEREVAFTFDPTSVAIPPGGEGWSRVRFSAKRPFSGEDRNRQLVVRAEGGHSPLVASATFIQKPTITRFRLYLLRVLVTLLGAGLMVVGAFLTWTGGLRGTEFIIPAFLHIALSQTGEPPSIEGAMQFFTSCGLGIVVLAVVAALGILTARARLTKLGAGLGLVLLIGFIVVMASKGAGVDLGVFVSLFGCLVALAAGFMGTSKR
jgi:hypothetical protein